MTLHEQILDAIGKDKYNKLVKENNELKKENEQLKNCLKPYTIMRKEFNDNLRRQDIVEYNHASGYAYSTGRVSMTIQEEYVLNMLCGLFDYGMLISIGPNVTNVGIKIVK